jgi:hypothetical protein
MALFEITPLSIIIEKVWITVETAEREISLKVADDGAPY